MNTVAIMGQIKRSEGFIFPELNLAQSPADHGFLFASRGRAKLYIRQNRLRHEAIKIKDKFIEAWVVGNVNDNSIRILLSDGYHEFRFNEVAVA